MGRPRDLRTVAERARSPVVKDPAKTLEIGRKYMAGETIKQIAEQFDCGHETVRKILQHQGIDRRCRGPVLGSQVQAWRPDGALRECAVLTGNPQARVWCAQCERNVVTAEAVHCSSRWCKAGKKNFAKPYRLKSGESIEL